MNAVEAARGPLKSVWRDCGTIYKNPGAVMGETAPGRKGNHNERLRLAQGAGWWQQPPALILYHNKICVVNTRDGQCFN